MSTLNLSIDPLDKEKLIFHFVRNDDEKSIFDVSTYSFCNWLSENFWRILYEIELDHNGPEFDYYWKVHSFKLKSNQTIVFEKKKIKQRSFKYRSVIQVSIISDDDSDFNYHFRIQMVSLKDSFTCLLREFQNILIENEETEDDVLITKIQQILNDVSDGDKAKLRIAEARARFDPDEYPPECVFRK